LLLSSFFLGKMSFDEKNASFRDRERLSDKISGRRRFWRSK
jgi:hypothetical protein